MSPNWSKTMFRILSLDGGGIRGAFAAAFIARIEQELGHPITDHFDLIAGTSTGGIIALGLGLGEPADRIRNLYEQRGPKIFTRRPTTALPAWQRTCLKIAKKKFPGLEEAGLHRSKYDSKGLADALREVYGIRTMEDATASRLVIPAIDLVYGRTVAFKTPHQPDFIRDRRLSVVDVALATTAAPTFFSHAVIGTGSAYSDGGLWANNPAIMGYVEAMKICKVCQRPNLDAPFTSDDVYMLSVGTGEPQYTARASNNVREIAAAAHDGRIKTLFVAVGAQEWTRSPSGTGDATNHQPAGDQDLLDVAALDTFMAGGTVFAVTPELVPGRGPAAAVFRY